jgi:hypothetical protein
VFAVLAWYSEYQGNGRQALTGAIMAAIFVFFFILSEVFFGDWRLTVKPNDK